MIAINLVVLLSSNSVVALVFPLFLFSVIASPLTLLAARVILLVALPSKSLLPPIS